MRRALEAVKIAFVDELRFDGRVAVVTGAGRGLGRAHALLLAERGAAVVVNDLGSELGGAGGDPGPAHAVAAEIAAAGGRAAADGSDVASEDGAAALVAAAIEQFGRVDVVVNNAGILAPGHFPEVPLDDLTRHLAVHLLGSFNVTRAAWPHLVAQRYGRVVMTTSSAIFGAPHLFSYAVAKSGIVGLARTLAVAGAADGIKVNLLAPAAETRMVTDPGLRAASGLAPLDPATPQDPTRGPAAVSPTLAVLAHESCPANGEIISAGGGRIARIFLAETRGVVQPGLTPEQILAAWDAVVDERDYAVPASTAESVARREEQIAR
jgi:NAD(P)-dependent dehydrogenase (short-subunit alcohol dehydrogenase family)